MITCKFSCKKCGLEKREVTVRYRSPDEDIKTYVEQTVGRRVTELHRILSPLCRNQMFDLMLPVVSENGIGYA